MIDLEPIHRRLAARHRVPPGPVRDDLVQEAALLILEHGLSPEQAADRAYWRWRSEVRRTRARRVEDWDFGRTPAEPDPPHEPEPEIPPIPDPVLQEAVRLRLEGLTWKAIAERIQWTRSVETLKRRVRRVLDPPQARTTLQAVLLEIRELRRLLQALVTRAAGER